MTVIDEKITTRATREPKIPSLVFPNPFIKRVFLSDLVLTLDAQAIKSAAIKITIGNMPVYSSLQSSRLTAAYLINVAGRALNRTDKIQVFVWNTENDAELNVNLNGAIFEDQQEAQSYIVPANPLQVNQIISTELENTGPIIQDNYAEVIARAHQTFANFTFIFSEIQFTQQYGAEFIAKAFDIRTRISNIVFNGGEFTLSEIKEIIAALNEFGPELNAITQSMDLDDGLADLWNERIDEVLEVLAMFTGDYINITDGAIIPFARYSAPVSRPINMRGNTNITFLYSLPPIPKLLTILNPDDDESGFNIAHIPDPDFAYTFTQPRQRTAFYDSINPDDPVSLNVAGFLLTTPESTIEGTPGTLHCDIEHFVLTSNGGRYRTNYAIGRKVTIDIFESDTENFDGIDEPIFTRIFTVADTYPNTRSLIGTQFQQGNLAHISDIIDIPKTKRYLKVVQTVEHAVLVYISGGGGIVPVTPCAESEIPGEPQFLSINFLPTGRSGSINLEIVYLDSKREQQILASTVYTWNLQTTDLETKTTIGTITGTILPSVPENMMVRMTPLTETVQLGIEAILTV